MTSLRSHVVSVLAVLMALAVGVALGGGPLSDIGPSEASETSEGSGGQAAPSAESSSASSFQGAFTADVSRELLDGKLRHRPVSLVTLPGVDPQQVTSTRALVKQAGGAVTGTFEVHDALLDPENSSLVSSLGAQMAETFRSIGVTKDDPAYVRMGRLIGFSVASRKPLGEDGDRQTQNVLSGLKGAEFLTRDSGNGRRGSLVLVLLGDRSPEGGVDEMVAQLATGMAGNADGLVVAGSTESAEEGLLEGVRADERFTAAASSTDSFETLAGRVTALLAVAADEKDRHGHYGATGSDGAVPRG